MYRVVISPSAKQDIDDVFLYISEDNRDAAIKVYTEIIGVIDSLEHFPKRGREGNVEGTREHVLSGLPYIIVYEIDEKRTQVHILSIWHDRQLRD
jgi:addiction module RelE/StbE family toxin